MKEKTSFTHPDFVCAQKCIDGSSDMNQEIGKINTLEECATGNTILHRRSASSKIVVTLGYILCVVSFSPYELAGLFLFLWYPVVSMAVGKIRYGILLKRLMLPLPFALVAGMSNLYLNRQPAEQVGSIVLTYGMMSFGSIFLKTILTVMTVLILIGTTPLEKIAKGLGSLHVPHLFIVIMEMIYRYLSVLITEAKIMYEAYLLRNPGKKALQMKDMGNFLGQLVLRSIERAERIFEAMKCRGDTMLNEEKKEDKNTKNDWIFLLGMSGLFLCCRLINI